MDQQTKSEGGGWVVTVLGSIAVILIPFLIVVWSKILLPVLLLSVIVILFFASDSWN